MSDNPFNASWSSKGNTLCLGHWDITYLGLPVVLPLERRDKDMGTNNIYNFMDPEDELYREGLMEDDWIVENIDWLSDVFIEHNIDVYKRQSLNRVVAPSRTGMGGCDCKIARTPSGNWPTPRGGE